MRSAITMLLLTCGTAAGEPPMYEIIDLGDLGGELANGLDINQAGQVAGQAELPKITARPFIWTDGEMVDLGAFSKHPGAGGVARGISNSGLAAGGAAFDEEFQGNPILITRAFFWSDATGMVEVTPGLDPLLSSEAWGVNSSGIVVGKGGIQGGHSWFWTQDDGLRPIFIPGSSGGGHAEDVNDAGQVTGHQWTDAEEFVGWVYDTRTDEARILPNLGFARSEVRDINDAGDVVGRSRTAQLQNRSVLWPADGSIVDLGLLNEDVLRSVASGLNNDRVIVGTDATAGEPQIGWIWIDGEKFRLDELIADDDARASWIITSPLAINDAMQITGIGIRDEIPGRAFLMTAIESCGADLDGDGDADADDFFSYLDAFASGDLGVCDVDGDQDCDADDFFGYLDVFAAGC